jgi:hypothetical protein
VRRPPVVASFDADGVGLGDEISVRVVGVEPAARRIDLARV